MPTGSFEKARRLNEETTPEQDEPSNTLYVHPLNYPNEGANVRILKIQPINQNAEKTEKAEVMSKRFAELALLLEVAEVQTPVEVSGEQHWMKLGKFFKDGEETAPDDLIKEVEEGLDPSQINIQFRLTNTEGRPESLYIDFSVPVDKLLQGTGNLAEVLGKNITDIFGGTTSHYQKIEKQASNEVKNSKEAPKPSVSDIEKMTITKELEKTGARVATVQNGKIFTVIAEYQGNPQKTIMLSLFGGNEPWKMEKITGKNNRSDIFTGSPDEILAEIDESIKTGNP